jgi:hypothetical protein
VNVDIAVETVVVWRREEISPLVQELLVAVREVLGQQKKTMTGVEERETSGEGVRGESHWHSR